MFGNLDAVDPACTLTPNPIGHVNVPQLSTARLSAHFASLCLPTPTKPQLA